MINMKLKQAKFLANDIILALKSGCVRIEIAGSIRRDKPEVKDIEIVVEPKYASNLDMFGINQNCISMLDPLINELLFLSSAVLCKNGKKYKQISFPSICLDLFIVTPPAQWGVIFTLRTGPAYFSHRLVSPKYNGFGYLSPGHKVAGGALWYLDTIIPTPEEKDFFDIIGLDWIEPKDRI